MATLVNVVIVEGVTLEKERGGKTPPIMYYEMDTKVRI
jgi:hypothetical protein